MDVNNVLKEIWINFPNVAQFCFKLIVGILAFVLGRKVVTWLVKLLRTSLEKMNIDQGVVQFTCSLSKYTLYALIIFNIAFNFGVKESSVVALLGSAGVTIGLALQGGLANITGGVMLLIFKPFQVGDYIVQDGVNGCEGTVAKIEICYTTLRSIDNKSIVIPNGTLSNCTIVNVTARDQRKLEIKVGISYDSDMKEAKAILEKILHEDEDTQSDTEMEVFVDSLGDHSVVMGFRVWVPTDKYWPTKWRLNEKIKEEFDAHGISIPYQQMDVHIIQKKGSGV